MPRLSSLLIACTAVAIAACTRTEDPPGTDANRVCGYVDAVDADICYQAIGEEAFIEGDVSLGPVSELGAKSFFSDGKRGSHAIRGARRYWPWAEVPYVVSEGICAPLKAVIQAAIAEYANKTSIRWIPRTNESPYVTFSEAKAPNAPADSGVGMLSSNRIRVGRMTCENNGLNRGIMIHEMGHALGLWHEHNRSDRDSFITINKDVLPSGAEDQFEKHGKEGVDMGPYDLRSVMHYPQGRDLKLNKPTIARNDTKPSDPDYIEKQDEIGACYQTGCLTDGDIESLEYLYSSWERPARSLDGGPLDGSSQIATATNSDGRLELFAVKAGGVIHNWQVKRRGAWSGEFSLGGASLTQISATYNKDGRLEVFAIGGEKQELWHNYQVTAGGAWSGWTSLKGGPFRFMVASKNADGRLEVFAIKCDQTLNHIYQLTPSQGDTEPEYSPWKGMDGAPLRRVAVAPTKNKLLRVFAINDNNGGVITAAQQAGQFETDGTPGWDQWAGIGGGPFIQITAAREEDGRVRAFGIANGQGDAWENVETSPGAGWAGWISLGGGKLSQVAVGRNDDGRLELFGIKDGKVFNNWQRKVGGAWSGWARLGKEVGVKRLAVALNPTIPSFPIDSIGYLELFAVGSDNGLWHVWQKPLGPPPPN